MFSLFTLALLASVPLLIYIFLIWNFDYWRRRGVKSAKSKPLLGSFPSLITQKQHFGDDINDIYKHYKHSDKFVGVFLMRTPQLMILDPTLVHDIYVTAFKHFQDNDIGKLVDPKKDPLIANNPFILTGPDWAMQRALVSPGLTGSRIKLAYSVTQGVCQSMCDYIERECKAAPNNGINGKDLALRFTSENIADCVLGIKAKSFTQQPIPISENVKMFSENNKIFLIYSLMAGIYPSIIKYYKAKFFPRKCENFFLNLIKGAYNLRRVNKVERQDILNYLITLSERKNLNEMEIASHSMTFLIDGLDTSAAVISHCLLLLAREPQTQKNLRAEILKNLNEHGELSFEKLNELQYLDACVHESIRIFPPGIWSTKICTEPYEFTNTNGHQLKLRKGEAVMIPMYAIHHDPDYYPNPSKFIPERFMPENGDIKKFRDMGLFLGFGDGPRTCLGMRFAVVQVKAAVSIIIQNFNVRVNPKTKTDNKLDPKSFLALQHGGVWLDFEKII